MGSISTIDLQERGTLKPQIDLCVAPTGQPPGLSAPGTDPRRRYLIKMEPRWKRKISEFLQMIPPLRGGDFQGIAGLSSDASLLVGVSTARERSFKIAPTLPNIGSMSPARLSLSTVASPHCRLLFHLAGKNVAEKTTKVVRAAQNQASVIAHRGLEVKQPFYASGLGRNIFLTFPFIDQVLPENCAIGSPDSVKAARRR